MRQVDGWWIPTATRESQHPVRRRQKKARVIELALQHHTGRRIAIQGGAHLGLWPMRLAEHFDHVWAFEPVAENYECAIRNIRSGNVTLRQAALGQTPGRASFVYTTKSTGTHHVAPTFSGERFTDVVTIDAMKLSGVDAIFLDVEGYELATLIGSRETIERDKPVIVCEENACGERYGVRRGDIGRYLSLMGYRIVQCYAQDLIFAC